MVRDDKALKIKGKRGRTATMIRGYFIFNMPPGPASLCSGIPCHPEWEEIFNFHYAGMTGID
jgi:hypothetical protein